MDPKSFEPKWQERWVKDDKNKADDSQANNGNKRYCLVEFPYPSGNLHVGHWYAFAVPDIYVRYLRMKGENVMFPIGFDAFGLPAENAAIKHNLNPRDWTEENMKVMEGQLKSMGASFDWSRKVATCDPNYYRWTQWLFLKLFDAGLAYQAETNVNWCPSCKTVLANEQVKDGACERCGSKIEQRRMNQWQLRITKFADALVDDLKDLNWPESIKAAQREWIGRSEGAEFDFKIDETDESITIFTTRADTLFGVTYVVIAPEHPLVKKLTEKCSNRSEIESYVSEAVKKRELDRLSGAVNKTGVLLDGVFAINPANGEKVPVWVADYVLGSYGTGAVMAVPAHDERDWEFAEKYKLSKKDVIEFGDGDRFSSDGNLIESGEFSGQNSKDARKKITEKFGRLKTQYRLRDWLISRQRYWGCPIPVIHCDKCGVVGVPEDQLPVELPSIDSYLPADDGSSPLARSKEFVDATCFKCGGMARRETDTLDTFIDSSWYYFRYCDPNNEKEFASQEKMNSWMPVDFYSGGAEHTTMHLLYSRFFAKALQSIGLTKYGEPFKQRMNRGLILGPDGEKMSKSKGNVIDPDKEVEKYGADTVRMYLAFIGPYAEVGAYPWDPNSVTGVRRFLERVWRLSERVLRENATDSSEDVVSSIHKTLFKVGEDVEKFKFNTAVSAMMICLNEFEGKSINKKDFETFLKMLAPFAPHTTEEIWSNLGSGDSIHNSVWPEADASMIKDDDATIAISINGKVRGELKVLKGLTESEALKMAMENENIKKFIDGKDLKRVIYVQDKILNIVV